MALALLEGLAIEGLHQLADGILQAIGVIGFDHQAPRGHGEGRAIEGDGELAAEAGGHVVAHPETLSRFGLGQLRGEFRVGGEQLVEQRRPGS